MLLHIGVSKQLRNILVTFFLGACFEKSKCTSLKFKTDECVELTSALDFMTSMKDYSPHPWSCSPGQSY